MIQEILNDLGTFILEYNKYFGESFTDVSLSPYTYYIMSGEQPVFPADNLGNYFYLRTPNYTKFDYGKQNIQMEGVNGIGLNIPLTLVACVRSANPDTLLENLITTLSQINFTQDALPYDIKFIQCTSQKEIVIMQELSKMPVETIKSAIMAVDKDYAIASITFTISSPYQFQKISCIKSPTV